MELDAFLIVFMMVNLQVCITEGLLYFAENGIYKQQCGRKHLHAQCWSLSIFSFTLLQITFFSLPVFPIQWFVLLFLPIFLCQCLLHDPPLAFCLLAGNLRLQQIVNPIDPLEILADVHWTHIRQKEEEEEKVGPTSKSSTSRGKRVPCIWFPLNVERPILRPSSRCF